VNSHEEAITGQLALALAAGLGRRVHWQARGRNGITAAEALVHLLPDLPQQQVDVVAIAFGVNDTTAFRNAGRWSEDLLALWQAVRERCSPRLIILCGVPPVGRFPALPQPLRWVLGLKADALDTATRELAAALPATLYVPVAVEPSRADLMAHDGYHPSAAGCAVWARVIADACIARYRNEPY
jgi:lysophospholipase L1-like esterase